MPLKHIDMLESDDWTRKQGPHASLCFSTKSKAIKEDDDDEEEMGSTFLLFVFNFGIQKAQTANKSNNREKKKNRWSRSRDQQISSYSFPHALFLSPSPLCGAIGRCCCELAKVGYNSRALCQGRRDHRCGS